MNSLSPMLIACSGGQKRAGSPALIAAFRFSPARLPAACASAVKVLISLPENIAIKPFF